jgi:hypothetical protein
MAEEVNEAQEAQQETSAESVAEQLRVENQKLKASMTRQGWELGELRKKTREMESKIPKEPVDFIAEPEKAVTQVIDSHPVMQALQQERRAAHVELFKAEMSKDFPDHEEMVSDPQFVEWLQKSKVRARTYLETYETLDPELGKELLAEWKAKQDIIKGADSAVKNQLSSDMKAAKVTTGSSGAGKKVYTTHELQQLQRRDPEAYKQVALRAFAEGRVK